MAELEILLKEKIMIRRLKRDVITQLPAKRRQMVMLDPGSVKTNKILTSSHSLVGKAKVRDETFIGGSLRFNLVHSTLNRP